MLFSRGEHVLLLCSAFTHFVSASSFTAALTDDSVVQWSPANQWYSCSDPNGASSTPNEWLCGTDSGEAWFTFTGSQVSLYAIKPDKNLGGIPPSGNAIVQCLLDDVVQASTTVAYSPQPTVSSYLLCSVSVPDGNAQNHEFKVENGQESGPPSYVVLDYVVVSGDGASVQGAQPTFSPPPALAPQLAQPSTAAPASSTAAVVTVADTTGTPSSLSQDRLTASTSEPAGPSSSVTSASSSGSGSLSVSAPSSSVTLSRFVTTNPAASMVTTPHDIPHSGSSPNSSSVVLSPAQPTNTSSGGLSKPSPGQPSPVNSKKNWAIAIGILLPIFTVVIAVIVYRRYCRHKRAIIEDSRAPSTDYRRVWAEKWVLGSSSMLITDAGTERDSETPVSYPGLLQLTPNASMHTLPSGALASRSRRSSMSSASAPWKHIVPRASTDSSGGSSIYVYDDSIHSKHDLSSLCSRA